MIRLSMEFSLWRKDGVGNRYAVSESSTNAVGVRGYIIQLAEGEWIIESDPLGDSYPTAQDAAEILIRRESN